MSNASLELSSKQAINESKFFSQVVKGNGGDYSLTANIFSVNQPMCGFAMTVKMDAGWTLKRASNDKMVWQEAIRSEHTSAPGNAFAGRHPREAGNRKRSEKQYRRGIVEN